MRKEIYLAVIDRLRTLKNEQDEQAIKHFDLWNNNVEFLAYDTPFETPALFIEFAPIQWKHHGGGVQQASIEVRLHIVTKYKGASADDTNTQSEAIAYFDLLDKINDTLFGLQGTGYRAMIRIGSHTNHNHDELVESIEVFNVSATYLPGSRKEKAEGS